MRRIRVLVTNARRRKAVPIIRALGKAGMDVICADSTRLAAGFYSRYCRHRFVHPPPTSGAFAKVLIKFLMRNDCDAIFALDDDVLEVVSRVRNSLPRPGALLLPDHETLMLAGDKTRLVPYAANIGVPVPRSVVIASEVDLARLAEIEPPLVIKPSHGSGGRGIVHVGRGDAVAPPCRALLTEGRRMLVQEQIPAEGEGLGYFALYGRDKQLLAQFMHRRLREYPIAGGPSTLREGIWDERVAADARRLLEGLGWIGVAMVEFKRDPRDGVAKLMEINPRFWGSIALAIFSEVDFPVLAARETVGHPVEPVLEYPLGRLARWFWPGDVLHLLASVRRGRWPRGFFRLWDRRMCYDLLSISDPQPAIALTVSALLGLCNPAEWRRVLLRRGQT